MATIAVCGPVVGTPEYRIFESGTQVFRFSVRDSAYIKPPQGEQYAPSQFYSVEVWGEYAAKLAEMIYKGLVLGVSGQYVMEEFTDRSTGEKIKKWLVKQPQVTFPLTKAQSETLLDAAGDQAPARSTSHSGGYQAPTRGKDDFAPSDEEVPF
jgi:single-stranded DNA-binding protein